MALPNPLNVPCTITNIQSQLQNGGKVKFQYSLSGAVGGNPVAVEVTAVFNNGDQYTCGQAVTVTFSF